MYRYTVCIPVTSREYIDPSTLLEAAQAMDFGSVVESMYSVPARVDENEVSVEENPGAGLGTGGQMIVGGLLAAVGIGAAVMGHRAKSTNP
jgi:hypothetical protein